jgi:hypothetical protein
VSAKGKALPTSGVEDGAVYTHGKRSGALVRIAISLAATIVAVPVEVSMALAASGDQPFGIGWYNTVCSTLRTKTGVQGDVLFACDPNGEACDIDLPGNETNREARSGINATGFCADSIPIGGAINTTANALETNTVVQGSSFTSITGVKSDTGTDTEAANIVCSTFTLSAPFTVGTGKSARVYGPGVRVCRKIKPCDGGCPTSPPSCSPPEQAAYFVTVVDTAATNDTNVCADVQALVTGSIAPTAPNFAFALFIDVDTTPGSVSQPGRPALVVCPGYQAQCVTEADRASVALDYRLPFGEVQTPGCTLDSKGNYVCCCIVSGALKCTTGSKKLC